LVFLLFDIHKKYKYEFKYDKKNFNLGQIILVIGHVFENTIVVVLVNLI